MDSRVWIWGISFCCPGDVAPGQPVFLDDMTLDELRERLPVPVRVVHGAADIVASALRSVGKTP